MEHPALAQSRQLLLVVTSDWNASTGRFWRFQRAKPGGAWNLAGETDVSVGRNGLAWGKGLLDKPLSPGPTKHEGDGKAPAGIFALGPAFGYGRKADGHYPYVQVTEDHLGVDDPKSVHYNSLVRRSEIASPDWDSAEVMLRKDDLYRFGLVVEHNWKPGKQPEAFGSCIFMHIWSAPGVPTSGCTAMAAQEMAGTLKWLDASKQPRLVQLTRADYQSAREGWGLPEVAKGENGMGGIWLFSLPFSLLIAAVSVRCLAWRRRRVADSKEQKEKTLSVILGTV